MNAIEGINLLLDKYAEKHKKKLSPGEKIIGIFNNCTMIFDFDEDGEMKMEVSNTEPVIIDESLDEYEEV